MVNKVLSREDGGLNSATTRLITSRNRVYKDVDITFNAKPNGELFTKRDAAAVKQAVKNLILTNHFEKPFEPFFGGNIRALLFELADEDTEDTITEQIIDAIEAYEPRARILDIFVNSRPDNNSVAVTIEFSINNTEEVVVLQTTLSRLR
jgi:phage baseplate assembly protein W